MHAPRRSLCPPPRTWKSQAASRLWQESPLYIAVKHGRLEIAKYLVSQGADLNTRDKRGKSLLHEAASLGDLEQVKFLISKGVDINVKDKNDSCPLHDAAEHGNLEITKYLIYHGADVNAKGAWGGYFGKTLGWTPLHVAALAKASHLHDIAGHLAESVVGYFLSGIPNIGLAHFPERGAEPEVDFVLTIGEHRIPLEVKYRQQIDPHRDTLGLRAYIEKSVYNAPFGILVTMNDGVTIPDPRITAVSLPSLLLMR